MTGDTTRNGGGTDILGFRFTRKPAPEFSALASLRAHWHDLAAGRVLPSRRDIEPRTLGPILEYCFILERIAPGVARFRLAGQHLGDLMGLEVRGMPATALFVPESRRQLAAVLEKCCTAPISAELRLTGEAGIGRGRLSARMLLLPVTDDAGRISRILGCLQSAGKIGRQPRRLQIREIIEQPLHLGRPLPTARPLAEPQLEPRQPVAGFAESPAPFAPAPGEAAGVSDQPARRGPKLRLVVDNDRLDD